VVAAGPGIINKATGKLQANGVKVGDKVRDVSSPCVVDIPGGVKHRIEARSGNAVFLYAYEEGPYEDVIYHFDDEHLDTNRVVPEASSYSAPASSDDKLPLDSKLDLNNNFVSEHNFIDSLQNDQKMILSFSNIA